MKLLSPLQTLGIQGGLYPLVTEAVCIGNSFPYLLRLDRTECRRCLGALEESLVMGLMGELGIAGAE
jgi:hypothetical protein